MDGMNNDSNQAAQPKANHRFMANEKLTAEQTAKNFASHVRGDDTSYEGNVKENQAYYAWINGYTFGNNEMMDKFNNYIAMQPPPAILVDPKEISLQTYKMFIRNKIRVDSKGQWFIKLKMWWAFWCAK